jgi:hypothetical protein
LDVVGGTVASAKRMTINTPASLVEVEAAWRKYSQEELRVTTNNGPDQRISVRGLLRDRLAEGEGIAAGFVGGEVEMVGSDCRYSPLISAALTVHSWSGKRDGVIPPTVGPQARTASTAAAVVQCSS